MCQNVMEGFHTFSLLWTPTEYVFYVDGKETWRTKAGGVCQVPLYIKLSDEVGDWAGDIKKVKLPDEFLVDYVRVYDLVEEVIRRNAPASWDAGASESCRDVRGYSQPATTFVVHALSLVMVPLNPVEKNPELRQHRLNNSPLPHGHGSLRPSFSWSSLIAVDDPAAPLDVGFAKGSLAAAWTWFQKEISSSLKSGRMAHLLWHGVDRDLRRRRVQSPTRLRGRQVKERLRFGANDRCPHAERSNRPERERNGFASTPTSGLNLSAMAPRISPPPPSPPGIVPRSAYRSGTCRRGDTSAGERCPARSGRDAAAPVRAGRCPPGRPA